MNVRRTLALVAIALASIAPAVPSNAQSPEPADDGAPPEIEIAPLEPGGEIIHSWAMTPAGNDETGGGGNRSQFSFVADPGAVLEDAVTLYNLSNVALVFRIYGTDVVNNPDGGLEYMEPSDVPVGAGSWVDFGAEQVTLAAREQVTIPVTITVPENATPGDHIGGLLASNAALSTSEDGGQITVDRRTGTGLFIRINGPLAPELSIENVQTTYDGTMNPLGGSATVTYTVENRGNTVAGANLEASIAGLLGIGKKTAELRELSALLPGESVTFTEEFDDVPALGVAVGRVELTPAGENSAEIAASSSQSLALAVPIAVLLGVLALLFGWLALRAFSRHREADQERPVSADDQLLDEREPEHQPT